MKYRGLLSTSLYLKRFVAGFSTISMRLTLFLALAFLLAAIPFLTAHGSSAQAQANGQDDKFRRVSRPIRDQYIVVLRKDLGGRDVESIKDELTMRHGGNAKHVYRKAIKGFSVQLTEAAAIALSKDPQVDYVQEDGEIYLATTQESPTWGLDRIDQRDIGPLSDSYHYSNVNTGAGIHAYVIDTGIQRTHSEFRTATGAIRVVNDVDFVNDGRNGGDCNGHGTFVADVLGGNLCGVAKGVTQHNVRVFGCEDSTDSSDVILGIDWVADHHLIPAVANMSFGTEPDIFGNRIDYAMEDAVRGCIAAGVTCVVAAGNDNMDAKDVSPARVEEAITVGASTINDHRWSSSNFGMAVDLFAPGADIVAASNQDLDADGNLDDFRIASGTSAAAPFVSGMVARFLQVHPLASPAAAQGAIKSSATRDRLIDIGAGSPNLLLYSEIHTSLLSETFIPSISEASSWVNTGVDVGPDQWLALIAGGEIWSGVWLSGNNGPQGWNSIESSFAFPLPGSRPFSLLCNINGSASYVGLSNARADNFTSLDRLFLRTNDDVPGNGNGAFNCVAQVWKKLPDASSDFVSQSVPTTMLAGQTVSVSVTMKNNGAVTWTAGQSYKLGPLPNNQTWGSPRTVPYDVPPGSQVTFTFNVTAPSAPGVYNFQWRMLQEGVQAFGDATEVIPITVLAPSNQAMFVSQTVPTTMTAGEFYSVSVTIKNVGTTTWQAGTAYRLGSQNPQDNTRWGLNRVTLPQSVPPGAQVTFVFQVSAPGKAGSYNFQWRMVQDGVEWFGDYTTNVSVRVKTPVCPTC